MAPQGLVRSWSLAGGGVDRDVHRIVDRLCDRIEEVDGEVHAFLPEPDRRARLHSDADELLARWPDADGRPPLFGVPIGIKDVIRVDGFPTRCGSEVPAEVLAGPQASVVTRSVAAGALVAGKTVTAEFACIAPGSTRNPHALDHTPGGSSSGSAAAVAAGMVPLAIGTQTIGSVIRPASFCGVVGFKPGYGRIPTDGVIPHSPTLDTIGLFAADVASIVIGSGALLGASTVRHEVERPVLGVVEGPYMEQHRQEAGQAWVRALLRLVEAGYDVRSAPLLDDLDEIRIHNFVLNRYELARTHERWLRDHPDGYQPETVAAIEQGMAISSDAYGESRAACLWFRDELPKRMAAAGVDLVITPATLAAAPKGLANTGDASMSLPWTYAGAPSLTLPIGTNRRGLPLGLQCVARPGADELLLASAPAIEAALAAP